jgi:alpha-glucosidase
MKKPYLYNLMICIFTLPGFKVIADDYHLRSPDNRLIITITVSDKIRYSLQYETTPLITPSELNLKLADNRTLGRNPQVMSVETNSINEEIKPLVYHKVLVNNHYNELRVLFKDNYSLCVRAFDQGIGMRWETTGDHDIVIQDEKFEIAFPGAPMAWMQLCHTFTHGYEFPYDYKPITALNDYSTVYGGDLKALMPVVFSTGGCKLLFTNADVSNYPHMYLTYDCLYPNKVKAVFAPYPLKEKRGGYKDYDMVVTEKADYIAKSPGKNHFPWRVFMVEKDDRQLMNNDLVYLLSRPPEMDFSWVKPGKCVWDWWVNFTLAGVDFQSGINNDTYKYYIDFAAKNRIEYVNFDEGWSDPLDLGRINPKLDIPGLIAYAREKGVGVFLWCTVQALNNNTTENFERFKEWGVAGLKIDFFDRDDQLMNQNYEKFAREAALRKIHVNFHGSAMPSGLQRTYPNILNFESVRGLEYNKNDSKGTCPELAATLPFTRMACGPFDYTPGALRNVTKQQYHPVNDNPVSIGTRCQQLAMYVVFNLPLAMLADRVSDYEKEPDILRFLIQVPTTWDEIVPLEGEIGQYAALARRKGKNWYVGAINNVTERKIRINCRFLPAGKYYAEIYSDGANAQNIATDYVISKREVNKQSDLEFELKPGGGLVIQLTPVQ